MTKTDKSKILNGWTRTNLLDVSNVNPREKLAKGTVAPYVAMERLRPFTRQIAGLELREFKGGTKFRNGDTLVARITPCLENGKTSLVDILSDGEIGYGSTEFIVLRGKEGKSTGEFLYYFATSPRFREAAIKSMTGSSGRQRVQTDVISARLFNVPLLTEQKAIADVLSSLDDKIELLRKQNETLEVIAQTIFEEWFVNFNFPDKNGKPYKDNDGKMIDSELGEIPEGWRVGKIGDEVKTLGGGTPSTKESSYWESGTITWYSPTDLTNNNTLFSLGTAKRITEAGLAKSSAKLFPKYSLLMSSRATIGAITINTLEACTNQGFIVTVPNDTLPLEYLHGWLLTQLQEIKQVAVGSTFPEISKSVFRAFNIIVPDKPIIDIFKRTSSSTYKKIENNTKQITTLSQLRDTLLPKLMNGQVRVKGKQSI